MSDPGAFVEKQRYISTMRGPDAKAAVYDVSQASARARAAPCVKRSYRSKRDAKRALKQIRSMLGDIERDRGRAHVYRCPKCGLWHWGHSK